MSHLIPDPRVTHPAVVGLRITLTPTAVTVVTTTATIATATATITPLTSRLNRGLLRQGRSMEQRHTVGVVAHGWTRQIEGWVDSWSR